MPIKTKTILSKKSKEHGIRFGNNHNKEMLIIQKSFKLIWEQHHQLTFVTIIVRYVIHNCFSFEADKKALNS